MTDLKIAETQLMQNLISVTPMLEEITEAGMFPMCLIGFKFEEENTKIISSFSTLNDEHDIHVLEVCKQLLLSKGYTVTLSEDLNQNVPGKNTK